MDPLSFHSVYPFATFYPPQSAEYDAYPVRGIMICESSQIPLIFYIDLVACSSSTVRRFGHGLLLIF